MKKESRRRKPRIDIFKVLICLILLVMIGFGTKVFMDQQKLSQPVANVGGEVSSTATASAKPNTTSAATTETPTYQPEEGNITINKTEAKIAPSKNVELKVNGTTQQVAWTSSDETVAKVSKDGVVNGVAKGKATITAKVGDKTVSCTVTVQKVKQLALTFDDGPGKYTPEVLDALEKYHAHATFFVVGQNINNTTKAYMQRAVELGCQYGNHSYTHPNFTKLSKTQIKEELDKCDAKVKEAIGVVPTIMRQPGGAVTNSIKQFIDKGQILWSKDTEDWKYRDTERLVKYVLEHAEDGDIILMHDIHPTTTAGVERIVKGLTEQGFELLTIDELSEAKNEPIRLHHLIGCF
ncbi:MAG: polysaccharide deacetylase family protein [bacterium]|nr:polysaccharide deacetylase family protein [bacterium]